MPVFTHTNVAYFCVCVHACMHASMRVIVFVLLLFRPKKLIGLSVVRGILFIDFRRITVELLGILFPRSTKANLKYNESVRLIYCDTVYL